jgi:hypothetical protein
MASLHIELHELDVERYRELGLWYANHIHDSSILLSINEIRCTGFTTSVRATQ